MKGTLRSAAEFARVMRKGKTVTTPDLVIHLLDRGDEGQGRYGLVVAKKERGAVARNRAKRQLRAAIGLAGGVPNGIDAVIILRKGRDVGVEQVRTQIWQIMSRVRQSNLSGQRS